MRGWVGSGVFAGRRGGGGIMEHRRVTPMGERLDLTYIGIAAEAATGGGGGGGFVRSAAGKMPADFHQRGGCLGETQELSITILPVQINVGIKAKS